MLFSKFFPTDKHVNPVNEVRLDLLLKQTEVTGFLSIVLATLLAYLMLDTQSGQAMIIWVASIAFMFLLRRILFYNKIHALRKKGESRFSLYHGVIVFFLLVSGLQWGIGAYLFLPNEDNIEFFLTFLTALVGITAGNMPSFAPSLIGFFMFMVPTLLGAAFKIYSFEYYVLFSGILIYILYLALSVVRMSKVIIHAISTDIENETLLKQVTLEKISAEKANQEKSHFLAAASHDLRQPLNSMGLFLYALGQQLKSPKAGSGTHNEQIDSAGLFNKVEKSYSALKSLFDALLEVSRLDAGNVEVNVKPLCLKRLISPITDELSEQAKQKNLNFSYQCSHQCVTADPVLLSRIIRNLVGNAIKYTSHGEVKIIENIKGNTLKIQVIDTGIGIPESELENIFNEYQQLANKRRDRSEGIGLGLSIVKKMAQLMSYEINVESTLGKGSCFSIVLPTCEAVNDKDKTDNGLNSSKNTGLSHATFAHTAFSDTNQSKRILVIDDEQEILQAMSLLLSSWGYKVDCADSYQQALNAIQVHEPHLILSDYRLQDNMNGIQALLKLAVLITEPVKAIIITGDTDTEILEHIQGNGFECLHKPVDPMQLQEVLVRTFNGL